MRVFVGVDLYDLAPAHPDDVDTMVVVGGAVREIVGCCPADDDGGVMRQTLDPDISHGEVQFGSEPSESAKPLAQRLAVVSLAAQGVRATEAMVNGGHTVLEQGVEVPLVDALEVFFGDPFDDGVVDGLSPDCCARRAVRCISTRDGISTLLRCSC